MKSIKFIKTVFIFSSICLLTASDTKPKTGKDNLFDIPNNPKELGFVFWNRDYDNAIKLAEKEDKPILILFQEIPGCNTCVSYGEQVLTNPLVVDAIQELFIPLAIYNNRDGSDLKTLTQFNEPAWNNPVVRIITKDGKDAAKRVDGDYSIKGITTSMIQALNNTHKPVPQYLKLINDESISRSHDLKTATFSMYCFWEGEAFLGNLNGVISTKPGYINGQESVEVRYDPSIITYNELKQNAEMKQCSITKNGSLKKDNDPKYYLSKTILRFIPMTQMQAARINSAITGGINPKHYLSPSQIKLLNYIQNHLEKKWRNYIGTENLKQSWQEVINKVK